MEGLNPPALEFGLCAVGGSHQWLWVGKGGDTWKRFCRSCDVASVLRVMSRAGTKRRLPQLSRLDVALGAGVERNWHVNETLETFPRGTELGWMGDLMQELRAREESKMTLFWSYVTGITAPLTRNRQSSGEEQKWEEVESLSLAMKWVGGEVRMSQWECCAGIWRARTTGCVQIGMNRHVGALHPGKQMKRGEWRRKFRLWGIMTFGECRSGVEEEEPGEEQPRRRATWRLQC